MARSPAAPGWEPGQRQQLTGHREVSEKTKHFPTKPPTNDTPAEELEPSRSRPTAAIRYLLCRTDFIGFCQIKHQPGIRAPSLFTRVTSVEVTNVHRKPRVCNQNSTVLPVTTDAVEESAEWKETGLHGHNHRGKPAAEESCQNTNIRCRMTL